MSFYVSTKRTYNKKIREKNREGGIIEMEMRTQEQDETITFPLLVQQRFWLL